MIVRLWMSGSPISVPPETPISEVALRMARNRIRRLLVVDPADGHLLGIVSLTDVARAFPADLNPLSAGDWRDAPVQPVAEIMTRAPITVSIDTAIESVAALMQSHKIGAVPVLRGGTAVGLITESDVFRAFVSMTGGNAPGARITFERREGDDALGHVASAASRHGAEIASFFSTRHDTSLLASVRLLGGDTDAVVEEIWRTGHRVLHVERISRSG